MSGLADFRDEVGRSGPVCVRGGGTRWELGGPPAGGTREVRAPTGVVAFDPAEMTVVVGAGTPLADLAEALAEHRQEVALEGPSGATVGGVLAVGRSSLRRPRIGAVRDALLQADCVGADGALFTAGGPTVKNVTGYDLCRLLVGSLGTLALIGQGILRSWPAPERVLARCASTGAPTAVPCARRMKAATLAAARSFLEAARGASGLVLAWTCGASSGSTAGSPACLRAGHQRFLWMVQPRNFSVVKSQCSHA